MLDSTPEKGGMAYMRNFARFFSFFLLLLNLVIAPNYGAAQSCATPPANLVGWWPADGKATDLAGPYNGALVHGATFAPGYVGNAFALTGSQYVRVQNAQQFDVSAGDFTVDAWVYFNAVGALDQSIVDKMNDRLAVNTDGWRLLYQGYSDLFWFCLGGGARNNGCMLGNSTTVVSATNVAAGIWYLVAAVKTSTQISIYVNGNLENTTPLGSFTDTNSKALMFGAKDTKDMEGAYLNGLVDEVELFNRALAPSEILAIYNAGHTGKCKVEATLTPAKLIFAPQSVGTTSSARNVTLENVSPNGGVLNIASIAATGDFAQTNQCLPSLNSGQKCVIQVRFTPTGQGTRTGALSVTYNSPSGLAKQVQLTGTGE
jgi:hypothetical protein